MAKLLVSKVFIQYRSSMHTSACVHDVSTPCVYSNAMVTQRRPKGSGSICFAPSSQLWIGTREAPTVTGKRACKRVTSTTFCGMLKKFSALPEVLPPGRAPSKSKSPRQRRLHHARKRGSHTQSEWESKRASQNGLCHYCGLKSLDLEPTLVQGRLVRHVMPLTKDHMIPLSRGGSDRIDNIVGACRECNERKHTMTAEEFMPTQITVRRLAKAFRETVDANGPINYVALAHTALEVLRG